MTDQFHVAKDAAGKAAADFIEAGMVVGLGTGSTAAYFIAHLIQRCKKGLNIKGVATSNASLQLALSGGIPMVNIDEVTAIDLTVDGADQIDSKKQMIKGAGGALLREKIVAALSHAMIVIVDERKVVSKLGQIALPIEVVPFGYKATEQHLLKMGYKGSFRKTQHHSLFITDNQNYIYDMVLPKDVDGKALNLSLKSIPGVVETGFFINITPSIKMIVGRQDGTILIK